MLRLLPILSLILETNPVEPDDPFLGIFGEIRESLQKIVQNTTPPEVAAVGDPPVSPETPSSGAGGDPGNPILATPASQNPSSPPVVPESPVVETPEPPAKKYPWTNRKAVT